MPMNQSPLSKRLGFRLWAESDLESAQSLWGDAEVTGLIGGPFSEVQVRERLRREIDYAKIYQVQYWLVFLLENSEFVGCCGLRPYNPEQGIYEIGVHLKPEFQGQGLAEEGTRAVMDYAFRELGVAGLFAGHHPENKRSVHLLEKLGFRYTHDEFYQPTGLNHPSYLITAEQYLGRSI